MIAPCRPAETIAFATYWAQKHEPFRLTSKTWSQSRSVISEEGHAGKHSGVVDKNVDRAEPLSGSSHQRLHLLQQADIGLDQ